MTRPMVEAALEHAANGWAVFPLKRKGKTPVTEHGLLDASTDPDVISEMWRRSPHANIGGATGAASGRVVLDLDTYKDEGVRARIEEQFGAIPETAMNGTASGGEHYVFEHPGDGIAIPNTGEVNGKFGNAACVRGDGGYVVLPGSIGADGTPYVVAHDVPLAPMPEWIDRADAPTTNAPSSQNGNTGERVNGAGAQGQGVHETIIKTAARGVTTGHDDETIRVAIYAWLDEAGETRDRALDKEIEAAITSARRKFFVKQKQADGPRAPLIMRPLIEFEEKAIDFYNRPFIMRDSFHVLAGRKAVGKGTLLMKWEAEATKGKYDPKRKRVLHFATEDDAAIDLYARAAVAGADLSMIEVLVGQMVLPDDIDQIKAIIEERGDVALVVIDPIADFMLGRKSIDDGEVRAAITPLNDLAADTGAAIIGVRHFTEKASVGTALGAVMGSSAFVQVPRAVIGVVQNDPADSIRVVQTIIGNRLPPGEAVAAFTIEGVERKPHKVPIPCAYYADELPPGDFDFTDALTGSKPRASKSKDARREMVRLVEEQPGITVAELNEEVGRVVDLAEGTLNNIRQKIVASGYFTIESERNEKGQITGTRVYTTNDWRRLHPDNDDGGAA